MCTHHRDPYGSMDTVMRVALLTEDGLGPLIIRVKPRSTKGGPCPDPISWIVSGLSPRLVNFLQICPDNQI
jgi:hypothetical protein